MKIKQAVILAGGKGIRLHPLTLTTPKPLIPINGKPFLEYILNVLKRNNIEEVVLLIGYLGEKIKDYFGTGEKIGLKIKYLHAPVFYDTGSRIREAYNFLDRRFLLLYADNYWPLNIEKLIRFYKEVGTEGLVTVYDNIDNYSANNVYVDEKGIVKVYDKKGKKERLNGVEIGFFLLEKKVLKDLPKDNFSFEQIIIPQLIKRKQLSGFLTNEKYLGLSNLARILSIDQFFRHKKVIILDRDGVINKKPAQGEYVNNWSKFIFLSGAIKGLKMLYDKGFDIFIVTNQAGIGRGVVTKSIVDEIHAKFLKRLRKEGILINEIYYCSHNWSEGCECRKPKPGMLIRAAKEHHFNLKHAFFIGDDLRDKEAGEAAGCKFIMMKQNSDLFKIASQI